MIRRLVLARAAVGAVAFAILLPGVALGHQLNAAYTSRLPLAVYLAGAAITVALSFAFVILRDVRVELPPRRGLPDCRRPGSDMGCGSSAWSAGPGSWPRASSAGPATANVATLFLWVYGWVGVAIVSALLFPIWHWLDPFSTLYDIGRVGRAPARVAPWEPSEYPERLGRWPAAIGFAFFIWLELALIGRALRRCSSCSSGTPRCTLAMMAQFGRDEWRSQGETFTVWFRLLGRLAPFALADEDGRVRRRSFAGGLLEANWTVAEVTIVALGVGSILFDGLSQTQIFFELFGFPALPEKTVLLLAFLGIIVAAALVVVRSRRPGGDRRGAAADRGRLPDRALPDVPAHRRPADRRRRLRPVPARDGTCSGPLFFEPSADLAAAGPRVDAASSRRWSAATWSEPGPATSGRGRDDAARDADPNGPAAATAAGRRDGGPHDADPVVAGPGPRGHARRNTDRLAAHRLPNISPGNQRRASATVKPDISRGDGWPRNRADSGPSGSPAAGSRAAHCPG